MTTRTSTIRFGGAQIKITIADYGDTHSHQVILLLHGGGGPQTVAPFGREFAETYGTRVIIPTHPGFDGTERHPALTTIGDLARMYAALLEQEGLSRVTAVGNSIGGWIAVELATRQPPALERLVLAGATGLQVDGHPVADFFALDFDQLAELSYANPDEFRIDPQTMPAAARAAMATSRAALRDYAGTTMVDPTWPTGCR